MAIRPPILSKNRTFEISLCIAIDVAIGALYPDSASLYRKPTKSNPKDIETINAP